MQGCAGVAERPAADLQNQNQSPQSQQPANAVSSANAAHDQAQFEADKRAVYKHPLFPLLALLLERCEAATGGSESPGGCDAFAADLRAFVQHQQRDRKPFLVDDPEIDGLMIKSIQVLRIHLLELEKVQELCRDFCSRYIACLKSKMQSENLLRTDYASGEAFPGGAESNNNQPMSGSISEEHSSTSNSPQYQSMSQQPIQTSGQTVTTQQYLGPNSDIPLGPVSNNIGVPATNVNPGAVAPSSFLADQIAAACQQTQTYEQKAAIYHQHQVSGACNPGLVVLGSTPIGQIGANLSSHPSSDNSYTGNGSCGSVSPSLGDDLDNMAGGDDSVEGDDDGGVGGGKGVKRGVLPRSATQAMRAWLFQHLVHPYPTEEEKRCLAAQTRLTLLQVNNWFINARRRILQPMLDGKDNAGGQTKRKQSGGQASKRFWPDSLSALQPQLSTGLLSSSEDEGEEDIEESDSEQELVIDQQTETAINRNNIVNSEPDVVQFHATEHN